MKNTSKKSVLKSVVKKIPEVNVKEEKTLSPDFSNRVITAIREGKPNLNFKREILPAFILGLVLTEKEKVFSVKEVLIKAGYKKDDDYLADGLLAKVIRLLRLIEPKKFSALIGKETKTKIITDNLKPVITEITLALAKK